MKEDKEIKDLENKIKNPWKISTIVVAIIAIILLVMVLKPGITGNVISEGDASSKLVDYLNSMTGGGVSYVESEDLGNIYAVSVLYQGREVPVYVTKDGKYFVQGLTPITSQTVQEQQEQQAQEVVKSDKPKVELFIMTHCPYGTQAEKGLIPVLELLGDKIDAKIRFVHYFMHGDKEEEETKRQVCIREEQSNKYLAYLKCFLEAGESESCLTKTGVNKAKVDSCMESKADDYYSEDSALSQSYGVQGSPTLIINGVEASSGRSPSAYLATICSAFNAAPSECEEQLSSENPSAGFGYSASRSASGGNSSGQC